MSPPRAALLSLLAALTIAPAAAQTQPSIEQTAIAMAEALQVSEVVLSPDGKWATYTVTRLSVEKNTRETTRYLQRVPRTGEALEDAKPLRLPENAVSAQWRPNSTCLSMVLGGVAYDYGREEAAKDASFACYDIASGETKPIPTQGRAVTANYKWSPSGDYVAFAAPLAERAPLDPRRGVPLGLIESGEPMALFVLDVKTGAVTQLTSDTMNVARSPHGNFAWSPDERWLAVAIDRQMQSWGYNTADLVVIDRRSRRLRTLVTRPGMNGRPCFSPDGRSIAFATHQSDPAYRTGWPAVISATGGKIVDFPQDAPMGFPTCHWFADSEAFFYETRMEMTQRLVRADAASRRAEALPQASDLHLAFEDNRSFSADGRLMLFTRESLTTPPDLFVVALDAKGNPEGAPVQLTNLAREFALGKNVHTEEISWPSKDGKFTIHGLLLTPARVQGRLPTLLYIFSGPSMVQRGFNWWSSTYLPLVARGYAVLIPNTRGRDGYGVEFEDAIRIGKNRARDPLADALAGLDLLIERGITDPERTGMFGFSYGGYLTSYAVTQTNRFKGVVSFEGGGLDYRPRAAGSLLARDLGGVHNPYDPAERARMIEESPGLHANRVRTPVLLLYGMRSNGPEGLRFYHELRHFNVPAAFFGYDEGHVFERPAAIADNITRTAEWLDYWVRGIPFPDSIRAKEYGEEEWAKKQTKNRRHP